MNFDGIFDVLLQVFNLNINFSIIFDSVDEPNRSEILKFVKYVQTKPSIDDLKKYNLSDKSKKIILEYLNYILKKTKL